MKNTLPRRARRGLAAAAAVACCSCASWWARTPEHVVDAAKILSCVIAEVDAGTSLGQVVVRCGLRNEQEVIDLVTAQKTAEARHARAGACGSASASSSATAPAHSTTPSAPSTSSAPAPAGSAK